MALNARARLEVVVVFGPGSIGQAIAWRVGAGKQPERVKDTLHAYQVARRDGDPTGRRSR
jgi:hypothetical protein